MGKRTSAALAPKISTLRLAGGEHEANRSRKRGFQVKGLQDGAIAHFGIVQHREAMGEGL